MLTFVVSLSSCNNKTKQILNLIPKFHRSVLFMFSHQRFSRLVLSQDRAGENRDVAVNRGRTEVRLFVEFVSQNAKCFHKNPFIRRCHRLAALSARALPVSVDLSRFNRRCGCTRWRIGIAFARGLLKPEKPSIGLACGAHACETGTHPEVPICAKQPLARSVRCKVASH